MNLHTPLQKIAKFTARQNREISNIESMLRLRGNDLVELMELAAEKRDSRLAHLGRPGIITYSKKVFIPVTTLCRDRCHYCTFVNTPKQAEQKGMPLFMSEEQVLSIAIQGARIGCKEALFTLGDRPEDRWPEAQNWLEQHGFTSTIEYLEHLARRVLVETGLLPHMNPGVMTLKEFEQLRKVSPSMGMMLETTSMDLWETPGKAHFGSPDKDPRVRLEVIRASGTAQIPFTTGLLIGIGETTRDRAESLYLLKSDAEKFGNIQEVIIQNFRAKPSTAMQGSPDAEWEEYLAAVSTARMVFGLNVAIQAPPNLADPDHVSELLSAGVDDWGGVSPLTPDHVNPERPWPAIEVLESRTKDSGYTLKERLTAHPEFVRNPEVWFDSEVAPYVAHLSSQESGLAEVHVQQLLFDENTDYLWSVHVSETRNLLRKIESDRKLVSDNDFASLLELSGNDLDELCKIADESRRNHVGDVVTYVTNRSILLDQFSLEPGFKDGLWNQETLREITLDLSNRGISEICLQGIPTSAPLDKSQIELVKEIGTTAQELHIHAFRASELLEAARAAQQDIHPYLEMLKDLGLRSIPGTGIQVPSSRGFSNSAANSISFDDWSGVVIAAHQLGLNSTAVIAFGSGETALERIDYLKRLSEIQDLTGGFTEFIPLPISNEIVPLVKSRTIRDENLAMTAVSRLYFQGQIRHIQAAWPRVGDDLAMELLRVGADDLGGTLDQGSILSGINSVKLPDRDPDALENIAKKARRSIRKRTTLYGNVMSHV